MKSMKYLYFIFIYAVIFTSFYTEVGEAIAAPIGFISMDALESWANTSHNQQVTLSGTLGNTYLGHSYRQNASSGMFGIGLRTYQNHNINVNTSLRFITPINTTSSGDILQLNSPKFHNLSYNYDTSSTIFLTDNLLTWTQHRLQPGFILGLGGASNATSHYKEHPLNNHSSTGLDHFSENTKTQLAYELGAVLDYAFNNNIIFECAYRYINAGHGQMGLSTTQTTSEHLLTAPLQYHTISIGVRLEHTIF